MKDSAKRKEDRPSKVKEKTGGNQQKTVAKMSADPEPEKLSLRLSPAEKMQLKSQLKEECFSVPMEKEMPIYWWYMNTLPKEEEEDDGFPLLQECTYTYDLKTEPIDEEFLRDQIKEEPLDDEMMFGTDGEVNVELMNILGKEGEAMEKNNIDLTRENEELKAKMDEMRKEHNSRMVNLITRASDAQAMDRARIEELTLKLAQFDGVLHPPPPPPSSDLEKLQLDLNFERVCRETEKRITKELEVKLDDSSKKLERARRELTAFPNIRELAREKEVLNREVADLKIKIGHGMADKEVFNRKMADLKRTTNQSIERNYVLQDRIAQLTHQLAKKEKESELQKPAESDDSQLLQVHPAASSLLLEDDLMEIDDDRWTSDQLAVKSGNREDESVPSREVIELQQKLQQLKLHLNIEHACREADKKVMKDQEQKIAELELKLAQYEEEPQVQQHLLQPLLQQQLLLLLPRPVLLPPTQATAASLSPERMAETAARALAQMKGVELHDTGHPTNLFQLCLPVSIESIPFQSACYELGKVAVTMDKRLFNDYCSKMLLKDTMTLHCDLCKKTLEKFEIIEHFLSPRHIREMCSLGAAVSTAAFKLWMNRLKMAAAVDATPFENDSINILVLCHPDSISVIPYEKAREKLLSMEGNSKTFNLIQRVNKLFARSPQLKKLNFDCLACEAKISGAGIIQHFIGMRHQKKMSALCAAVSRAALQYWLDKLQLESAATTTTPKVDGKENEIIVLDD